MCKECQFVGFAPCKKLTFRNADCARCQFVGCFQEPSTLDGQHQVLVCSRKTVSRNSLSVSAPRIWMVKIIFQTHTSFFYPILLRAHGGIRDHDLVLSLVCRCQWAPVSSASSSWMSSLLSSCTGIIKLTFICSDMIIRLSIWYLS